jgi:hypothetical protein
MRTTREPPRRLFRRPLEILAVVEGSYEAEYALREDRDEGGGDA